MESGETPLSPMNPWPLYFYWGSGNRSITSWLWRPNALTPKFSLRPREHFGASDSLLAVSTWDIPQAFLSQHQQTWALSLASSAPPLVSVPHPCYRRLHFIPKTCKLSLVPPSSPDISASSSSSINSTFQRYLEFTQCTFLHIHSHHPHLSLYHLLPGQQQP